MNKKYIALASSSIVRDVQICTGLNPDLDPFDGSWEDVSDAEIFLGEYETPGPDEAIAQASAYANVDPTYIRLITM